MRKNFDEIEGLELIEEPLFSDDRGTLRKINLPQNLDFNSVLYSRNPVVGTVRGLHVQVNPFGEDKVVTCTTGKILDVVLDLRHQSPTYGNWCSIELTPESGLAIHIPPGFAHGFQTLEDDSTVLYCVAGTFDQNSALTVNILDPILGITLPLPISLMSHRDRQGQDFSQIANIRVV